MKRYDFLLQKEALSIIILGGYKIALMEDHFLGSIDFKPIIFLEQAVSPFKSSKGGNAFESMLSSDMTKACISYPVVASFSFYEGQTKVMEITPESLDWKKELDEIHPRQCLMMERCWWLDSRIQEDLSLHGTLRRLIAFIDTANRKVTGTRAFIGEHINLPFAFQMIKSKVALWESGKKTIHIFNFQ